MPREGGERRLPLLALLLALAGAGDEASAASDPAAPLAAAMAAAEAALEQDEPELAESHYRSALEEGWLLLGGLAAVEGDLAAAAEAFERAEASVLGGRRARLARALAELEAGRPGEAATLLRRLAARQPSDLEVRFALARALAAAGNLDESIQELEELRIELPERPETLYSLATAYLRQGRTAAAEPLLEELARRRPGARTQVLIGRTWRDHGELDRARAALAHALELDPATRRAHYYLATVELLAAGRAQIEVVIEELDAELELVPEDPMANLYLGIALVESRRFDEALAPLGIATRAPLTRADALQFLGRAYLALDRPAEAVTVLREALEGPGGQGSGRADLAASRKSSLHYQLALALRRSGREDEAAPHFAQARDQSARLADSSREVLDRYLRGESRPEASEAAGPALEFPLLAALEPAARDELERRARTDLSRAHLNLGVFKVRERRFAGGAELLRGAVRLDPGLPRGNYSLGVALFSSGQFAQATAPLELALAAEPADAELRRMLALAHLNGGDAARAVELLGADPARESDRALDYAYARALVRAGRAAEAEPVFAGLLQRSSDWPELHVVMGQAAAQQGDYPSAERALGRAIELDPRVAGAHATLADLYLRQGRLGEAEAELRAELGTHPGDEESRFKLAMVLDLDGRPRDAERVLREHLDARPRSADARYLLGKVLLAGGAAEDALEQLTVAAELAPEDSNIRYQRGRALQLLGRAEEAAEEFELFRRLKRPEDGGGA